MILSRNFGRNFGRKIVATAAIALSVVASTSSAGIFKGIPDMILCEAQSVGGRQGGILVFHISGRTDDGISLYQSQGAAPLSVIVMPDGVVSDDSFPGCANKVLDELRAKGMTRDF